MRYRSLAPAFISHLIASVPFVIWSITLAITFTWVFNNTRGSLLLPSLFPSLPLTSLFGLSWFLVWVVVALLVIAATRRRLSYQRYLRETARPSSGTDREQEKGEARTSA